MSQPRKKPLVLCVLDGWGVDGPSDTNAIHVAKTPNYDQCIDTHPTTYLEASGLEVGLPAGQMGNSEVGHLTLGAGRSLPQGITKINTAIGAGGLSQKKALQALIQHLQETGGRCHLMGLLSNGGVHSHVDHILHMIDVMTNAGIPVALHAWLDGRDTPPQSAYNQVADFVKQIEHHKNVTIETISGRYYAMDRDQRWDRIKKAYDVIIEGKGPRFMDPVAFLGDSYKQEVFDEFIPPHAAENYQGIASKDGLLIANFRADRVRQLLTAMLSKDFSHFPRPQGGLTIPTVGMMDYADWLQPYMKSIFPNEAPSNTLGAVISAAGLTQLRVAETEKYAHVTYFFDGGTEATSTGEDRIMVDSPKVATYDQQPEMSAGEVTSQLLAAIESNKYDFVLVNFANTDMVGHTGNFPATVAAVEAVDQALGQIAEAVKGMGGLLLVTADHGNAEQMADPETGAPHTAHTLHKVPFIVVGEDLTLRSYGTLEDVAPTVLDLLHLSTPTDMTGTSLIT